MTNDPSGLHPERTIADLRELSRLTSDENGAQREAWTEPWARARVWEREKLATLPLIVEVDAAGNQWFTLRGKSERAVLIGSHIDSVPNGGWLDGCLGLVAGYEVLRHLASLGEPPVTVRLVDWADEEARFGRSLFGSGMAVGTLTPGEARLLKDRNRIPLPEGVAKYGVDVERAPEANAQLNSAAAYIELHIEQGPVLESQNLPMGVVLGTLGVERHTVRFTGQASHGASTPMHLRRDALAAGAKLELAVREIAIKHGGVCTIGNMITQPGVTTIVVGECDCLLDQRHFEADALAAMLAEARVASEQIAREEKVGVEWIPVMQIAPIHFHPELIELADRAIRATTGSSYQLPSGPLHDAAEVARYGIPTIMMFVQSLNGLSHNKAEDTREEHLTLAVEALDRLVFDTMQWVAASGKRMIPYPTQV